MTAAWLLGSLMPAALIAPAPAQESEPQVRVELRVMAATPGRVIVDRGIADGLKIGDRVQFRPRKGAPLDGVIAEVRERVATAELDDRSAVIELGTRGDAQLPASRLPKPPPMPPPATPREVEPPVPPSARTAPKSGPKTAPAADAKESAKPAWSNRDEGFDATQPLLSRVPPTRPEQREPRWSTRMWSSSELARSSDGGWSDTVARAGVDTRAENLFGDGGTLRADLEFNYKTELDDGHSLDLLPRRLSYANGGTRFEPQRFEFGRFLQHAVPEFGFLDGVEWGTRTADGDRFSASLGFMPQLDDDFRSFHDVQAAAAWEWIADESERLTATVALQQTWHDGELDRRLALTRMRWVPSSGWDAHVATWVDFYDGHDDVKQQNVELTQAIAALGRRFDDGGDLFLSFQHVAFPELQRDGEFLPLNAATLDRAHLDRLTLRGRTDPDAAFAVHGELAGFHDQDGSGGSAEAGFDVPLPVFDDARLDVTSFASTGTFTRVSGFRVGAMGSTLDQRWDCMYELADHRQEGFSSRLDDIVQHRFFASQSFFTSGGLRIAARLELKVWDDEYAWSGGLSLERSF